ncbi:MAG: DUF4262 domain-containing protein [Rhodococcus sp. (in: high G+C Gram-positive bacteria)]
MCDGRISVPDIERQIAHHGWAVTAVAGSGHDSPEFAYSTGLTAKRLPELLVYGLPVHLASNLIDDVADHLTAGLAVSPGMTLASASGHEPDIAVIEAIDTSDMWATGALYTDFTALQLVWPDIYGSFPWEPDYSICIHQQPLMGVGWV